MIKKLFLPALFLISTILFSTAGRSEALVIDDPFEYFNVYSLGSIGQSNDKYNTDIEGTIGAAGDVYFQNFGGSNLPGNEYVLHTGGNFYIQSGSMYGKMDIGGDFSIENYQVTHDVYGGGNAVIPKSTSGVASATVYAAGTIDQYEWNNINTVSGAPYEQLIDFTAMNQYFTGTSDAIAAMQPTGMPVFDGCSIILNAAGGVNVFNIDAAALDNSCNTIINGEADSIVYINAVNADSASLTGATPWEYNGVPESNVLLNYASASELSITSGMVINILAPYADTLFTSGLVDGNLITGNLYGGGQVNTGYFDNPTEPVPEPSTFVLLGSGIAGLIVLRKRTAKKSQL